MSASRPRQATAPLAAVFLLTAAGIAVNSLITPSLPEILRGVGSRAEQAGWVIGAATFPGIALAPVIGILADRYGRREVLLPCLVLFGVAGGAAAAAPNLTVLIALRILQGAGSAGLINLAVVLIGDLYDGVDRARMIGRNAAVLTVGLATYPILGGALTDLAGWRTPFLVYPLLMALAVALTLTLPRGTRITASLADQLRHAAPIVRQPMMMAALAGAVVTFALIFGLLLTVLPVHLDTDFGLSAAARGLLLSVPALTNTTVALSLARLQRFSKRSQLSAAAGLFVVGLLLIASADGIPALIAGVACFGFGEGLVIPNLQHIAAGAATARSRGAAVALLVSAARLGQTVGPVGASGGVQAWGARPTFVAGAAVAGLLLLPLVAIGLRSADDKQAPEGFPSGAGEIG